jgi:hypothetical protein
MIQYMMEKQTTRLYLLQEIGNALSLRALESTGLEETHDVLTRSMVHALPLRQENNIVKEVEGFRSWL